MTTIEDLIRLEYESLRVAIFPREKQEHADKIVQLEKTLEAASKAGLEASAKDEDYSHHGYWRFQQQNAALVKENLELKRELTEIKKGSTVGK